MRSIGESRKDRTRARTLSYIAAVFTAYVASKGALFADGTAAVYNPNVCVVAAHKSVPLGTRIKVKFPRGERTCLVRDRIGRPISPNHFDLLVGSRAEAIRFGKRSYLYRRVLKT